ncbi:hypothetical protein, partial [Acidovorax sp. A1169]|uniref:hypothetical protein n=1 Tax=Acidovorax sp. A1169 TaxID=3059524 RepID=UPI002737F4FB
GRLLFGDFLLAAKRKLLRRRAHTPASAFGKSTQQPHAHSSEQSDTLARSPGLRMFAAHQCSRHMNIAKK